MAWLAGEKGAIRSLGDARRFAAEVNAKTRLERAIARKRGDRCLVIDRRRIHRSPFTTGCPPARHPLRPRPPAIVALRTRANRQDGNLAQTKTALRRENHSR